MEEYYVGIYTLKYHNDEKIPSQVVNFQRFFKALCDPDIGKKRLYDYENFCCNKNKQ